MVKLRRKVKIHKRAGLIILAVLMTLSVTAMFTQIAIAENGEGGEPPPQEPPPQEPPPQEPPPQEPAPEPPPPTRRPSTPPPTIRPFPDWMNDAVPWPDWIFSVDEFPDWFFELDREPVWFRTVDTIPAWFFTIREIPDWFYNDDVVDGRGFRDFPDWMNEISPWPAWIYTVEEFPDWFFDLPSEPVWFSEVNSVPAWFYSITVIPDWFYAGETEQDDPADDDTGFSANIPYVPGLDASMFKFSVDLGNNMEIVSNVPNGIIVNDEVYILFPAELLMLMRDGITLTHEYGEALTEHGSYELSYTDNPAIIMYSFTIINRPVNDMTQYTVPDGFKLTAVFCDEVIMEVPNRSRFEMNQDGNYRFRISNDTYETIIIVEITLDTTPPELIFSKINDAGEPEVIGISPDGSTELIAPIVFSPLIEEELFISIRIGGSDVRVRDNTLTEPGLYFITVTDTAGNSSSYEFRILYIVTVPLVWVIVIASALIVTLTVHLVHNRRKFRVR